MRKLILISFALLANCQLFSQPGIHSFSPLSGISGSVVSIQGKGFDTTTLTNKVFFGAVQAEVVSATDTLLKVYVPKVATFQPITVTVNGLTAFSRNSFILINQGNSEGSFGAGSFLPGVNIVTGIYPHSVTFGDFNNDGKIDMLVSKGSSATVAVYENKSTEGNISFGQQQDLPALGSNHEGSATADFDGDGKLDIVIANRSNEPSVSVYRNISTGTNISFASKIDFATEKGSYNVAIGDLNGDGRSDMIVANNGSNVLSYYKNTSSPGVVSFAQKVDINAGTNPYGIVVSDLDGDGKPDLVFTAQGSSSALLVLKNTTTGGVVSFGNPETIASLSGPYNVSVGDLDGDGIPDIAAASSGGPAIMVVKNMSSPGNFSFYTPLSFTTGKEVVDVTLTDLDGDGKPDMVSANRNSNTISVLRNTSSTGNISFESHVEYPTGSNPFFVAAADLDGDGRPDIVSANSSENFVTLFKNSIGANITPVIHSFTPDTGVSGTVVKITGSNFTGTSSVKFGNIEAASFTVDSAKGITAIVGQGASGEVSVTTSNGTVSLAGFKFEGPVIRSFFPTTGNAREIITIYGVNFSGATSVKFGGKEAASFSVDSTRGTIIAFLAAGASGNVEVTTPNGTSSLPGFTYGVPVIHSFLPLSAAIGEKVIISGKNFGLNPADNIVFFGAVKAVIDSATDKQLTVSVPAGATYMPVSVTTGHLTALSSTNFTPLFEGDKAILSKNTFASKIDYGTGNYPSASAVSDLDGDGKTDLIITNRQSNSLTILKNTGSLGVVSFNTKIDLPTGSDPSMLAVGDLNGDGKPDIVVANFNNGNASAISVFQNTSTPGKISFADKTDYASGNGSFGIAIADMNRDGRPDIVVSSGNSGFFSIFINTTIAGGSVTFMPQEDFRNYNHPDALVAVDLDNDGRPDLVTSNFSGNNISVYRNQSQGGILSLSPATDYTANAFPAYITVADLDQDGKMDIVLSNNTSQNIMFFKNTSTSGTISLGSPQDISSTVKNIAVADLNGDGMPDIATGHPLSGTVGVMQNKTDTTGYFSFHPQVNFTTGNYETFVNAADLTGDGKPELIVTNTTSNTVSILKNSIGLPQISSFAPFTGRLNDTILINGDNFAGLIAVSFGGTPASAFQVLSSTQIRAVVGEGSSGKVEVSNQTGSDSFDGFKFNPQIIIAGSLEICKGQQVKLSSTASTGNQWFQNGTALPGETGQNLSVTSGGKYSLRVNTNGINTNSESDVDVKLITVSTPAIVKNDQNMLVSSAASGNQWYLNESILSGANQTIFLPIETGNYTVQTDSSGCLSDLSAPYPFTLTGMIALGDNQFINFYPNPVINQLIVNWTLPNSPAFSILITDMNGNKVFQNEKVQNNSTLNLSLLKPGMYVLKFINEQLQINRTTKIMKK